MQAAWIIACALCALTSLSVAILTWQRWDDPASRVLKWAVLMNPCAVGLFCGIGGLFFLLGRSRTTEIVWEALAGAAAVAFAAHWCLYIAYVIGRASNRHRRRTG